MKFWRGGGGDPRAAPLPLYETLCVCMYIVRPQIPFNCVACIARLFFMNLAYSQLKNQTNIGKNEEVSVKVILKYKTNKEPGDYNFFKRTTGFLTNVNRNKYYLYA